MNFPFIIARMNSLSLSTPTTSNYLFAFKFISHPLYHPHKSRILSFTNRKPGKFSVFASIDDSKFDEWDKMELKFGRMIGEDPKITLRKIMGRKLNPDMTYLEIGKLLENKKGKALNDEIEEVLFDVPEEKVLKTSVEGLNLVRPVPKKGTKFEETYKPEKPIAKSSVQLPIKVKQESKSSVPNVILRKPSSFNGDDDVNGKSSMFGIKPNLSLKMGRAEQQKMRFSDITLLKKPEPMAISSDTSEENREKSLNFVLESSLRNDDATLLQKPELRSNIETEDNLVIPSSDSKLANSTGNNVNYSMDTRETEPGTEMGFATESQSDYDGNFESTRLMSMDTMLIGKPKRLDFSNKATDHKIREDVISVKSESFGTPSELENFLSASPIKEREENDWARAKKLVQTGEREEVEIISSSTRGFAVSFGSLIGFLPYRNLAARWKFLAFESWLRRRGLDPGNYRQNLGIIGKYDSNSMPDLSETRVASEMNSRVDVEKLSDLKLEDLLMLYDQEKLKFLSSFVGQKIRVGVVLVDRNSRKLILSIKPKEKEELVEKKRNLMGQLTVGDIVKCCIKKITYFGVFVEVEGVPALIHQTEVSWDATLDPSSYFKVGQIVEAKVHQLDFSLERIFLSLKEITPDPLIEALEAVVGDKDSFGAGLEAAQEDTEWSDVETLIKELELFDGIQSVKKGRYFLSPGLAPTFQVYMASMFENQYKLLARAGNRVHEVFVQTSLDKDELKSAIMTCTNKVE